MNKKILLAAFMAAPMLVGGGHEQKHAPLKREVTQEWAPGDYSLLDSRARLGQYVQLHGGMVTRHVEEGAGETQRQGYVGLGPTLEIQRWEVLFTAYPWLGAAFNGRKGWAYGFSVAADHHRWELASRAVFAGARGEHGSERIGLGGPLAEGCIKFGPTCVGGGWGRIWGNTLPMGAHDEHSTGAANHPEGVIKLRLKGGFSLMGGALRTHEGWKGLFGVSFGQR